MRILVVSNLYPPLHIGGYELCCKEAVDGLRERGHEVFVLTSSYGVDKNEDKTDANAGIYRWLEIDLGPGGTHFGGRLTGLLERTIGLAKKEIHNFRAFRRGVKRFRPDVIYLWNLTHISVSIGLQARNMGFPTCYYIGDLWLTKWRNDSWLSAGAGTFLPPRHRLVYLAPRLARAALRLSGIDRAGSLDLRHVQFASGYLKNEALKAGEPVEDAEVLYWGIELEKHSFKPDAGLPRRMLCVGQVVPHKGLDTALEALEALVREQGCASLKLSIVGGSIYPDYVSALREKVRSLGLEKNVNFMGEVPREDLPSIYREHDLFLFPSLIDEGLGLSILEAMASGLLVLGTASGGSSEVLIHDQTGLVFPKGDAATCAALVLRALNDFSLFERIRRGGRKLVEERFEMGRLMENLERSLHSALNSRCDRPRPNG